MASDSSDVILDDLDLPDLPRGGADSLLVPGFVDAGRRKVWATKSKICPHCGRVIDSKHAKKHHQRFHINLELTSYADSLVPTDCEYQCLICGMGFSDGVTWKQHVSSDHRSAMQDVNVSDVTDGDVTSSSSRGRGRPKTQSVKVRKRTGKGQGSHVKIPTQKVASHIVCEICSATFSNRNGLTNHKLREHPESAGSSKSVLSSQSEPQRRTSPDSDSNTRVCTICSMKVRCDFPGAFKMHYDLTHGGKDVDKVVVSSEGKAKSVQKSRGSITEQEIGQSAEIVVVHDDVGVLSPHSVPHPTSPPVSSSSPVPALGINSFIKQPNNGGMLKLVSAFSLAEKNPLSNCLPASRLKCTVCQGTHTNGLQCHLCPHCNMKFTTQTIDAHQYKCLRISSAIHDGNSRSCLVCFEALHGMKERSVLNHMLFHTAHSHTFVCTFCLRTCPTKEVLTAHLQQHLSSQVIVNDLVDMYDGPSLDNDQRNLIVAPAFRNSGKRSVRSTSAQREEEANVYAALNEPDPSEAMAVDQEVPHDISESLSTGQVSIPTSSLKEEPTVDISSDEEEVDEFIECIYCGFTSDSGNAIRSHFFQTHPDRNFPRLDKHVKTQEKRLANAKIKKEKISKRSQRSMPGTSGTSNRSFSQAEPHSSSDESEELVECLYCDYTSDSANLIRAHFFQSHPEQNYQRLEKYITMHEKRIKKLKQQKTQLEVVQKKMEEQQKLFNDRLEEQNALVRQRLDAFDRQMQPLIQSRSQSPPRPRSSSRSPARSHSESVNRTRSSSPMVQISVTEYNNLAGRLPMDGPSTSFDRSPTGRRPVDQPRPLIKLEPLADVSESENEGPAYQEPEWDSDVPDEIDRSTLPDLDYFPVQDLHQVTVPDSPPKEQEAKSGPEKRKPGRPKSVNSNRSVESRKAIVSPSRQASYSRKGRGRPKKISSSRTGDGVPAISDPVSKVPGNAARRGRRGRPMSRSSNVSRGGHVVTPCSVVLTKCTETLLRSPVHTPFKNVSVPSVSSEKEDVEAPISEGTEPITKKMKGVSKPAAGTTRSSSTKPSSIEPSKQSKVSNDITSADDSRLLSDEDDPIDDYFDVVGLYDSDDAESGSPEKPTLAEEVASTPVKGAASRKSSETSNADSLVPSSKKKSKQRSPSPKPQLNKKIKVTLRQCSIRLDDISKKSSDSRKKSSESGPVSVPYSASLFSSQSVNLADISGEVSGDQVSTSGEKRGKPRPGRPRGRKRPRSRDESPEKDDSDSSSSKPSTRPTKRIKTDAMEDSKEKRVETGRKDDVIDVLNMAEEEVMDVVEEGEESDIDEDEIEILGEERDGDSNDSDDDEESVFGPDNERLPSLLKIPAIPKLPRAEGRVCPVCKKMFSKAMYTNGHILSDHAGAYLGKSSELKCPGCDSVLSGPQGLHAHLHFVHKKDAKLDIDARLLWKAKLEELSNGSSDGPEQGTEMTTVVEKSSVEKKKESVEKVEKKKAPVKKEEKKKAPVEKTDKKKLPVENVTCSREKRKSTSGIVAKESDQRLVKDVRIVAERLKAFPGEGSESPQKKKRRRSEQPDTLMLEEKEEIPEVDLVSDNDSDQNEAAASNGESSDKKEDESHCPMCSKIFDPTRGRNQEDHIVGHHAEELTGKPFKMKCSQCSYVSEKPSTFYKHIKNAHGPKCKAMDAFNNTRNSPVFLNILRLANDYGKQTPCDVIAGDVDESSSSTRKRKKKIPPKEKTKEPTPEKEIVESVSDDNVGVEETFPDIDSGSSYIAEEDRAVTPDQPWANADSDSCPVCSKHIGSVQLKREDHIISFHSRELTDKQLTVVCWECDDDFLRPINLYKHILMKHGPESKCMKKFRKLRRSRRYVKVLVAAYRERSEDGESNCGSESARPKRKLKKKENSDTGSDMSDIRTKTLDDVLKNRSDSQCPICGTEHSGRKPTLQMADHIVQSHSKELTGKAYDYKCTICSYTCSTQFSSLYMHMRKKHPDQPVMKKTELREDAEYLRIVNLAFEKEFHVEKNERDSDDGYQEIKEASEKESSLKKGRETSRGETSQEASGVEETSGDSQETKKKRVEEGAWGILSEAAPSSVDKGDGDKKQDHRDTEANPSPDTHSESVKTNPSTSSVRNDRSRHCLICGRGFPSPALTTDHIVDVHSLQLVNKQHTITCTVCGHVSSRCKSALQHIRSQHADKPDAVKEFSQIRKSKRYLDIIRTCKGLKYPVQNVCGEGSSHGVVKSEVELLDCFVLMTDCMLKGGKGPVLSTIKEEPVSRSGSPVSRSGTPVEELRKSVSGSNSPVSRSGTPREASKKSKRGRKPKQSKTAEETKESTDNVEKADEQTLEPVSVSSVSEGSAMAFGKVFSADASRDSPDLEVSLKDSISQCLLSLDDTSVKDDVTTRAPDDVTTRAPDDVTTRAPDGAAGQVDLEQGKKELATEEPNVTIRAESMEGQVMDSKSDESISSEPGDVILAIREDAVKRDDVTMAADDNEAKEVSTAVSVDADLECMDTSEANMAEDSTEAIEDAKDPEQATEDPEMDTEGNEYGTEMFEEMKEADHQTELSEDDTNNSQQSSAVPEYEDDMKDHKPTTRLPKDDATEVAESRMTDATTEVAEDNPDATTEASDLHDEAMENAPESAEEMAETSADEVDTVEYESDTKEKESDEPLDGQIETAETETDNGASREDCKETAETTGIGAVSDETGGEEEAELTKDPVEISEDTVEITEKTEEISDETAGIPSGETAGIPEESAEISDETAEIPEESAEISDETAEIPEESAEISEETEEIPEESAEISDETSEIPEESAEISEETEEITEVTEEISEETGELTEETVEITEETEEVPEKTAEYVDTEEKNDDIGTDETVPQMDTAEDVDMTETSERIQPDTETDEEMAGMEMAIAEAMEEEEA